MYPGFVLYLDLTPWLTAVASEFGPHAQEYALAQKLLDGGVGLHPGEEHFERQGHFPMVFSCSRLVLEEGLCRYESFTTFGFLEWKY